jgi:hypothetical protein
MPEPPAGGKRRRTCRLGRGPGKVATDLQWRTYAMIPIRAVLLALTLAIPAPVRAQGLDATYDFSMRGITGGSIVLKGREEGDSYAVSSVARATGVVGALVKYGYEGQAQGTVRNGRYVSSRYSEAEIDDGERTSSVTQFDGTTPASVTFDPPREPREYDIEPTAQRNVVDPLTALYGLLKAAPRDEVCNRRLDTFDGRHVARLSVGPPQERADGTLLCGAEYLRLRGYSEKDLEERPNVRMRLVLEPVGGGLFQVSEVRSRTRLGEAVLRRR